MTRGGPGDSVPHSRSFCEKTSNDLSINLVDCRRHGECRRNKRTVAGLRMSYVPPECDRDGFWRHNCQFCE